MSDPQREASWLFETVGVRRLHDAALIRVWDADRLSWLNGQITNDVSKLAPGTAVYALTVDLKGRIVADLWAIDRGEDLVLVVPAHARAELLAHFDKYIVMEDVEVAPLDDLVVLTAQGPAAEPVASAIEGVTRAPCDRLGRGGADLLVEAADADRAWQQLVEAARAAGGGEVSGDGWELARLRAAVPAFGVDFGPATLPQEAGLAERAVSFTKGCYLGQEVVCMLENRGKLRRRLVTLSAREPLNPGEPLLLEDAEVGAVTSSVADGEVHRAIGLVKTKASEPGQALRTDGARASVTSVVGSGDAEARSL